MKILGISASGRPKGITSEAVKAVLAATGATCEFISLAGKTIRGCQGCALCATTNRCVLQDDWIEIGDKMLAADAIVVGAPNYYGTINATGMACLERTFCFRHRDITSLAGKLGVVVAVDNSTPSPVTDYIRRVMDTNNMPVVGTVLARGYAQCYTCGYGHECVKGGVYGTHGLLPCIEEHHLPPRFAAQPEAAKQALRAGRILGATLRARDEGRL